MGGIDCGPLHASYACYMTSRIVPVFCVQTLAHTVPSAVSLPPLLAAHTPHTHSPHVLTLSLASGRRQCLSVEREWQQALAVQAQAHAVRAAASMGQYSAGNGAWQESAALAEGRARVC